MRTYRLDTFVVPNHALPDFLDRIQETHALLQVQPGFVQDFILEQPDDDESTRIATLVEWADEAAMGAAGEAVRDMRRGSSFDPRAFMIERGITSDMRVYRARQLHPTSALSPLPVQ